MLFNSLLYAFFLPVVVAVYWACPQRFRPAVLLIGSYIFYMSWRPMFVLLILALTLVNYLFGLSISAAIPSRKKYLVVLAVLTNLSTLAYFKYANFLIEILARLLHPIGLAVPSLPFDIVLPLGISFFVFEFIHYAVDVYRGGTPIRSLLSFALFASFFPTQIAGPIKRYQDFVPQLSNRSQLTLSQFDDGVALILIGLAKKVLLADNLSFFVQGGFSHPELFTGLDLWIFAYAFAFQIYFDFSGYTDIARGSAALFGFKVPANFNLPYLATNIADFWHRWHISLSTWLRDYLYVPLGGSRCARWKTYRNLLITMSLGGLWHGAAMHFVLWGVFHGLMLVSYRQFKLLQSRATWLTKIVQSKFGTFTSTLFTFQVVCLGWVLFRAETIQCAVTMLSKMCFLDCAPGKVALMTLPHINYPLVYPSIFLLLPLMMVSHVVTGRFNQGSSRKPALSRTLPKFAKAAWCAALIVLLVVFSPDRSPRFIYFQF